ERPVDELRHEAGGHEHQQSLHPRTSLPARGLGPPDESDLSHQTAGKGHRQATRPTPHPFRSVEVRVRPHFHGTGQADSAPCPARRSPPTNDLSTTPRCTPRTCRTRRCATATSLPPPGPKPPASSSPPA